MAGPMDFLRNNNTALLQTGLGLLGGRTATEQAAMGAQGLSAGINQNKTIQWLQGAYPELAQAVQQGQLSAGDAFKMAYQQKLEAAKPKNNFMAVGKNLYDTQAGEWLSPPAGSETPEFGLTPVWGEADGKQVIGQLSKDGTFRQTELPQGFQLSTGTGTVDLGTHIGTIDKRTGNVIATTPKDLAGAAAQKEIGEAQGKSVASAPGDIQAGQNAMGLIGSIRDDPNREMGTGLSSIANRIPASPGFDFQTKVDQAKSGAFLTAIEQMRGMGALSNAEGQTATAAVTRMNTATSEGEFLAALDDYEKIIKQGIDRAQSKLPSGSSQQGGVVDYTDYFKQ